MTKCLFSKREKGKLADFIEIPANQQQKQNFCDDLEKEKKNR